MAFVLVVDPDPEYSVAIDVAISVIVFLLVGIPVVAASIRRDATDNETN
jgi:hypothetical protein